MTLRGRSILILIAACCLSGGAAAQDEVAPEIIFEPPPRPIQVYLQENSLATIAFEGEHGAVQLAGRLISAPAGSVSLVSSEGARAEVSWSDILTLWQATSLSEGAPHGSYIVHLTAQASPEASYSGGIGAPGTNERNLSGAYGWRLLDAPTGDLVLESAIFGKVSIPVERVRSLAKNPLRGTVERLPEGIIKVEVLPGRTLNVPLPSVSFFRRDRPAGTVLLELNDGQIINGRLVELPRLALPLDSTKTPRTAPMEKIAVFEIRRPAGTSLGGLEIPPAVLPPGVR